MDLIMKIALTSVLYNPLPIANNLCDYIKTDWFVCMNEGTHDYSIKKKMKEFNENVEDCKLVNFVNEEDRTLCYYEHSDGTKSIFIQSLNNCPLKKQCLGNIK